jgi:hypothetical protein
MSTTSPTPTRRAPAKKATAAKKAPAKKAAAKSATTTKKAPAKKSPAKKAVRPLREREPIEIAATTGLAVTALIADTVDAIGRLPEQVERLRGEIAPKAEKAPERLRSELGRAEVALVGLMDRKAVRGRAVIGELRARPEVADLRGRALAARARLRAALGASERSA